MDSSNIKTDKSIILNNKDMDTESNKAYIVIKRIIDFSAALIGIILLSPIFILTAIAIRIESSGEIIFKQARVGKNGKVFNIYKFRSMKIDAPNLSTSEFNDSHKYITKTGAIIRKTSIDELPQLFNILKGEMSIVGPRPVIESEKDLLQLREMYKIDSILPGVTGWAQVNGRDNLDVHEKVKYDYEYLINKSIFLDIKIIFMTIFKVLKLEDVK